jgi:hypothetical protein
MTGEDINCMKKERDVACPNKPQRDRMTCKFRLSDNVILKKGWQVGHIAASPSGRRFEKITHTYAHDRTHTICARKWVPYVPCQQIGCLRAGLPTGSQGVAGPVSSGMAGGVDSVTEIILGGPQCPGD